jgi:hypothetical protein
LGKILFLDLDLKAISTRIGMAFFMHPASEEHIIHYPIGRFGRGLINS